MTDGTHMRSGFLAILSSLVLAAGADGPASAVLSFEDGLPDGIRAEKGTVDTSDGDCQDGRRALRWRFVPGDRLVLPTGPLGDITVWTGYGGYSRSAFEARLRTVVATGSLRVRFLAGEECGGSFAVPLVFDGWQRLCYHYSWRSRLAERQPAVMARTDRIVIEAPAEGEGGTLYLDALCFNRPVDFRGASEPIREPWRPHDPRTDPGMAGLLGPPTPDELAALAYFRAADARLYPGNPATAETVAKLEQAARGTFGLERTAEGRVAGLGLKDWRPLTVEMLRVARAWLHTPDPALRERLEVLFFLENDFLRQQGGVAQGALQGINWYGGRDHGDACYLMREPLRRTGRLPTVVGCMQYNYGYSKIFQTGYADTRSMDYFYIDARYLFKTAVMQTADTDAVIHLRAFSRRFSRQLADTIKPDGSLYHHGFHYFAYAGGASAEMAKLAELLAPTPFRVTPEGYEAVKRALLAMRWYANLRDLPMTLHGRHPGRQQLFPHAFRSLAVAGRPYHDGRLDPELARAALRLDPGTSIEGFAAEPAPVGHRTMPFAGLGCHRRDEWLAMVRGYGKYLAAQESYNNANRHGLFFGNGYLDILGGGSPVTLAESGCRPNEGWDWRRLDGTTVIHLPYAQMANGNGTLSERSEQTFVGGGAHEDRDGLFAMLLDSPFQYRKALPKDTKPVDGHSFRARKSWFFFGDAVLCLGSGIGNDDSPHSVQTNLFQKFLAPAEAPVVVDGEPWTALGDERAPDPERGHLLIDPQGTGYIVAPGQALRLARLHQTSRDGHDQRDTEGDYATAWLDHGPNPTGAAYQYTVLVKTTPERLALFARDTPLWPALRTDSLHACYDRASGTWGLAFFLAGDTPPLDRPAGIPEIPIRSVDRPCLAMASQAAARLVLSVACPDLALDAKGVSQERPVTVVLDGRWQAESLPPGATATASPGGTAVCFPCIRGETLAARFRLP